VKWAFPLVQQILQSSKFYAVVPSMYWPAPVKLILCAIARSQLSFTMPAFFLPAHRAIT